MDNKIRYILRIITFKIQNLQINFKIENLITKIQNNHIKVKIQKRLNLYYM